MDLYEPHYSQLRLRLTIEPSFTPHNDVWRLYQVETGYLLIAEHDNTRVEISRETGDQLLAELTAISIPPFDGGEEDGSDGESRELFHRIGLHSSRFRWWSLPPETWQPLVEFHQRTVKLFDAYCSRGNAEHLDEN